MAQIAPSFAAGMVRSIKVDACLKRMDALCERMDRMSRSDAAMPDAHVISLEAKGDCVLRLAQFLQRIGVVAGWGHSFEVIADAAAGEPFEFDIDGDGADRIMNVRIDGQLLNKDGSLRGQVNS